MEWIICAPPPKRQAYTTNCSGGSDDGKSKRKERKERNILGCVYLRKYAYSNLVVTGGFPRNSSVHMYICSMYVCIFLFQERKGNTTIIPPFATHVVM